MVNPDRDSHRRAMIAGNVALNPLYDQLATRVREIIETYGERVGGKTILRPTVRGRILRAIDAALNQVYPARPGVSSPLEAAIIARTRAVEMEQVNKAVEELRRFAPDVVEAYEQEIAKDGAAPYAPNRE